MPYSTIMSDLPTVSVTIPCRNELNYIAKCLDSLVSCTYDKDKFQVFVCDGMSDDGTRDVIAKFARQYPFIQLIDNHQKTTPQALNLGLRQEGYDIRFILGAHAEIDEHYILRSVKCFEKDPKIGCVGGIIENAYEDQTSGYIGAAMSSSFGVGNAHFRTGSESRYVDTVAFGAYKAQVFQQVGYFDEDLVRNQDDEFNFRLHQAGFKIWLDKDIRSKYYVRASKKKLFRQYYQYGYWKVFVNKKFKQITTVRQLVPMLFVAGLLLGWIPALKFDAWWYVYAFTLGLYFSSAWYYAGKKQKSVTARVNIISIFLILHIGYGLGYWEGILRFILLGKNPGKVHEKLSR